MSATPPGPIPGPDSSCARDRSERMSPGADPVSRNVTWIMLQRSVELAVRFFVGAWLVRYLGPEQFGIYNYAISFTALFAEIASLGLDQIVVRDLARRQRPHGEILATAMALRLLAGLVAVGIIYGVTAISESDPRIQYAVFMLAGQLLINPAMVLELWFQAQVNSKYVVGIRTAVTLLVATLQVIFILAGLRFEAFVWLLLLQAVLTAGGLVLLFGVVGPGRTHWRTVPRVAANMLREAWPLLIAGMSIAIYMRIDQVMLEKFVGIQAVGIYGAAVKVSELWYAVPTAVAISAFPGIVTMRVSLSADTYRQRLQALYDALALYSYAVILFVWIFAPQLVLILFGPAFVESAAVLRVHVASLLFVSLGVVYVRWLTAESLMFFSMISTLVGVAVNVALNFVLIPSLGAEGAAWATLISYAAATFLAPLAIRQLRPALVQLSAALLAPLRVHKMAWRDIFQNAG